jgi:hypothetical protein
MPYYHATWRRHLQSIRSNGLGGALPDRRNFSVADGVYLAVDPFVAISMLIEACAEGGEGATMAPPEALDAMCIIVVDDARVDQRLVHIDPNIERRDLTILYRGVIDVSALPVLSVDDVVPSQETLDRGDEQTTFGSGAAG